MPSSSSADPELTLEQAESKVGKLHHEAEVITEKNNATREKVRAAQKRLAQIQREVEEQQAQVAKMQAAMGDFAAAQYRSGGMDQTLKLLLANDPKEFLERASRLNQITGAQADQLHEIQIARLELASDKAAAQQQFAELERLNQQVANQKEKVQAHLRKAQQVLNDLEAEQRARLEAQQSREAEAAESATYDGAASGRAGAAVSFAYDQLGEPYVYGAAGPDAWDCSGLTMGSWANAGVSLPHNSEDQYYATSRVAYSDMQPGDLVFYYSPISHVAIYIGDGQIIHASNPEDPVTIAGVDDMPFTAAGRP
ncbi:MAG: NlpC/P60 family protein [Streptomycetales bacterium]